MADTQPDAAATTFAAAAARFVDECLRSDGSLFVPSRPVWTLAHVEDLYTRFVDNPDFTANRSFQDKLRLQTASADPDVVLLAAELFYVLLLPQATGAGGATKLKHVNDVLAGVPTVEAVPSDLAEAIGPGIASYGAALAHRFPQYSFLLEFARAWKRLGASDRDSVLDDPWRFREFVFTLPSKGASSQVEALLHMVFPESFEPIVSVDVKQKIVSTFREHVTASDVPIDAQIAEIRDALTPLYGSGFSFYDDDVRTQWSSPGGANATHAWFLRGANDVGVNRIPTWLAERYASVGRYDSNSVAIGMTIDQLVASVAEENPERSQEWVRMAAGNLDRFFRRMSTGDLVLTVDGQQVFVGEVHGDPGMGHDDDDTMLWVREVDWQNEDNPASRNDLSPALQSKLKTQVTLTDISAHTEELRRLVATRGGPAKDERPTIAPISEAAATPTYLPASWLQQIIDLLNEKQQVIFYGPPGTGKTFVAQVIGEHVRAAGGSIDLVQFHPAYSYEDFFEGYRPVRGDGGGLEFALAKGPLRRMVDRARKDPSIPHLLVIDEINRGNMAKIFGELYFLLEYRDTPIHLQYSAEEFRLPDNLFLIGTMNTADRSIALIDSALRRRFYFYPFLPHEPPVENVLEAWLADQGFPPDAAELLKALNAALQEALPSEEFAVGPSYLMPKRGQPNIDQVWRYAIMPLLVERFFGVRTPAELEQSFGHEALRRRLRVDSEESAADT